MFSKSCRTHRMERKFHETRHAAYSAMKPSGNSAFDAYKADTLRRLQDEQDAFETFLERLRAAKDKTEFDQFMDDRAKVRDQDHADDEPAASA